MKHEIQLLDIEKWNNYEAHFSDFADNCYNVEVSHDNDSFSVFMNKVPLKERKIIKYPQRIFAYADSTVKAWGIVKNEEIVAGVVTSIESNTKSPRLYIPFLWVDEAYRRKGVASDLVNKAKERAKDEGLRAVYLQTRSCNEHAIAFYLSQGFKLIGFDSCPFSNEDIEKFNVPLKFGYFL